MSMNLNAEIEALKQMTVHELQDRYIDVFGERTRSNHKQYLIKRIAWRIQAQHEGDLSTRARRRAMELADDADLRVRPPLERPSDAPTDGDIMVQTDFDAQPADDRLPMPGTTLSREYKGRTILVRVLRRGFEYSDIKTRGETSRFVQTGPNTFALRTGDQPLPPPSKPVAKLQGKHSFTDAAEKVLEKFGEKRPMHYREITAKALELDWIATEGKTPEATMYAQILSEIGRYQKRGEQARFVQHGRGYVGLSRWMGKGLAFEIEQHNKKIRHALRKRLLDMKWDAFEELVARLLATMGFEEIEMTDRSRDGGIDVRGTLVVGDVIRTRMAIQVKKWKRNVQAPIVQQVRGSLGTHEQGLIITTSGFSSGARTEAARPDAVPVALMDGEQLVVLLVEHGIERTAVARSMISSRGSSSPIAWVGVTLLLV